MTLSAAAPPRRASPALVRRRRSPAPYRCSALTVVAALATCAIGSLLAPFLLVVVHRRAADDANAGGVVVPSSWPRGGDLSIAVGSSAEASSVNDVEKGKGDGDRNGGGGDEGRVRVFIAVKTTAVGVYQERIAQVRRTWLRDAVVEPDVDIRFFVGNTGGRSAKGRIKAAGAGGRAATDTSAVDIEPLVVPLDCPDKKKLCKTFGTLRYFLKEQQRSSSSPQSPKWSFFCNFDDDSYVLIPALLRALSEYARNPPHFGTNLYIGQQTLLGGVYDEHVRFHTGGAYCLSSDLIRRGAPHFDAVMGKTMSGKFSMPDDVAVGYLVGHVLGNATATTSTHALVDDARFMTHLDRHQPKVPRDEIAKQVAFGYDTKWRKMHGGSFDFRFANVPRILDEGVDPLLFRSLRCFLLGREEGSARVREEYKTECGNATDNNAR